MFSLPQLKKVTRFLLLLHLTFKQFFKSHVCVWGGDYGHVCAGTNRGQKRTSSPLELESQVGSHEGAGNLGPLQKQYMIIIDEASLQVLHYILSPHLCGWHYSLVMFQISNKKTGEFNHLIQELGVLRVLG